MLHRTPSGEIIGSTKPKSQSQVVDPTCWPTPQSAGVSQPKPKDSELSKKESESYKFELLPSFPRTLVEFKKYDGAKALTAFLLILATVYFLLGFLGFLVDHTSWLRELFHKPPLPGVSPKPQGGSSGKELAQLPPTSPLMLISSFAYLSLSVPTV
ncbi:MAG: hypothetical protein HC851_11110 [Acaryochloris sp. RU_4_1]|nr:hypothetical protein [Acaryochloris sp. SU_5_25]NJM66151.1 hypothetical protein [Acaryochloris sp. RU_4_1]NJR54796.1 hypothetical protein [Acaryochloris sp. CRU_2_0]